MILPKLCPAILVIIAVTMESTRGADNPLDNEPIIAVLIEATKDPDAEVRYAAYAALTRPPHSATMLELFWHGMDDESLPIRVLCLRQIVQREGPTDKVLTSLVALIGDPDNAEDRFQPAMNREVQSQLISLGTPTIPYLMLALKEGQAKQIAATVLGRIPLGEHRAPVITQLSVLLNDEENRVRLAAVRSLESIMQAAMKESAKLKSEADGIDPRYLAYYTKLIEKYDTNSDGVLTQQEWSKMSKDPAEADADKDGRITPIEFARWALPK